MPGGKSRRGQTVVSLGAERTAIAGQGDIGQAVGDSEPADVAVAGVIKDANGKLDQRSLRQRITASVYIMEIFYIYR
jgi:hypothetical protein